MSQPTRVSDVPDFGEGPLSDREAQWLQYHEEQVIRDEPERIASHLVLRLLTERTAMREDLENAMKAFTYLADHGPSQDMCTLAVANELKSTATEIRDRWQLGGN